MRKYVVVYNSVDDTWRIGFMDDYDEVVYIDTDIPPIAVKSSAIRVRDALNK